MNVACCDCNEEIENDFKLNKDELHDHFYYNCKKCKTKLTICIEAGYGPKPSFSTKIVFRSGNDDSQCGW